jgi:hypothetical protein
VSAARSPWRAGELRDEIVGMSSQRVGAHQRWAEHVIMPGQALERGHQRLCRRGVVAEQATADAGGELHLGRSVCHASYDNVTTP